MYTFNGGLSAPPHLATADGEGGGGGGGGCSSRGISGNNATSATGGNIPRTPEILNSLIAMTNPLEYSYPPTSTAANCGAATNQNQVGLPFFYLIFTKLLKAIASKGQNL